MNEYERLRPVAVDVQQGEPCRWCGCGKSATEPFCDRQDCTEALEFVPPLTETVMLCVCKQTRNPPYCDGSHAPLLVALHRRLQEQG